MIDAQIANDLHEDQLAAVLDEYLAALGRGESPSRDELLRAHRHLATDLRACLAALDGLDLLRQATCDAPPDKELPGPDQPAVMEAAKPTSVPTLGGYELLREIGRGGMGVVYEAQHCQTGQRAAVKILPRFHSLDARQLIRFKNESAAAAHLDHPNIVRVLASGCENNCHFYVMELIEGRSLTHMLSEVRRQAKLPETALNHEDTRSFPAAVHEDDWPLEPPCVPAGRGPAIDVSAGGRHAYFSQAARWARQAALALDHAHGLGVVHRDIKPSNLLVDADNDVWIADFGVARLPDGPTLTRSGDMVGTLRYMSPEQCSGRRMTLDHRTDIYSLGATLYELLTFRPAFSELDRALLLLQLATAEPPPPRRIQPALPRDLETIVLRAMAKDREQRYQSARDLADDLERFLQDRPVRARRPGPLERGLRWGRAHSGLVAAGMASLAVLAVVLSITTFMVWRAQATTAAALEAARRLNGKLSEHNYASSMNVAFRAWFSDDWKLASSMLDSQQPSQDRGDLRGFEWHLLDQAGKRQCRTLSPGGLELYAAACSADGRWAAAAGEDATVFVWDARTGDLAMRLAADDVETNAVAFSPGGDLLACGGDDGTVRIWKMESPEQPQTLRCPNEKVQAVAFGGDGKLLLAGDRSGGVCLWRLDDLSAAPQIIEVGDGLETLAVSPDGKQLATAGADRRIVLRDLNSLDSPAAELVGHKGIPLSLAFASDGQSLASGGQDGSVRVWDVGSRRQIWFDDKAHSRWVQGVAVAPGGKVLASASKDGTVRLWDMADGRQIGVLVGHRQRVWSAAFSADGKSLYTSGADGTLKQWFPAAAETPLVPQEPVKDVLCIALSPNGDFAAASCADGQVAQIDLRSGQVRRFEPRHAGGCRQLAYSRDGSLLVSGGGDGRVRFWDPRKGSLLHVDQAGDGRGIDRLEFTPDGSRLLALAGRSDIRGRILAWQVAPRKRLADWEAPGDGNAITLALAPNGRSIALGNSDGSIDLHEFPSGRRQFRLAEHDVRVKALAYAPDGKLLASGQGRTIDLWNAETGKRIATFSGHEGDVLGAAFSNDGRTLASGAEDGELKLWSAVTHQELTSLWRRSGGSVNSMAFSHDGSLLTVGAEDKGSNNGLLFWFAGKEPDWSPQATFQDLLARETDR